MKVTQKLLTKNQWSRPDRKLHAVRAIVLHWIADPHGTPISVFNWFEQRKKGKHGYGSCHYCVGVDGATMQYIPDEEMAYQVGSKTYTERGLEISKYPNDSTLGIEMCHMDWEGSFSDETWDSTVKLTALLLSTYNLNVNDIVTHMDVVGWKDCPRWFQKFPEELVRFKKEVKNYMQQRMYGHVNARTLNVRDKPKGMKLGVVKNGELIYFKGIKNGWLKISYNNNIGWVFGKYVK